MCCSGYCRGSTRPGSGSRRIKLCERCVAPATVWFEHQGRSGDRSAWMVVCDMCYAALNQQPSIKIQVILENPELVNSDPAIEPHRHCASGVAQAAESQTISDPP